MSTPSTEPLTNLRGAQVAVDARVAARALLAIAVVGLLITSIVLFVAGADKNAQITALRVHGVHVEVTVDKCLGLLGGSGSNAAGYACTGHYLVDGRSYDESIPGNGYRNPGSRVAAVSLTSDPELLSTSAAIVSEQASARVFIAPTVLLIVDLAIAGAIGLRLRGRRRASVAS